MPTNTIIMKTFLSTIKFDYLQRVRSYSFLITLCISLAVAYTFVPEPNANYSTIRIADHVGYYNAAWFGYVTAIMTSIFLSLIGFYLVNGSINKDLTTKIGHITASTRITNFKYLLSKVLSNFLVLVTIVFIVFLMSIILFYLYNDGYSLKILDFLIPYLLVPIPAMFFIAVLAIIFEIVFRKYSVLQNIGFFFLFSALVFSANNDKSQFALDPFGTKIVMHQMEETVRSIIKVDEKTDLSIGYAIGNIKETKKFEFNGISFSTVFILSRFIWVLLGMMMIMTVTPLFHRFSIKEKLRSISLTPKILKTQNNQEIIVSELKKSTTNYGIISLVKTELMLLFRKGKRWLWIINIIGVISLAIAPINIAYPLILPVLWFLQVHRLSEISSKEIYNNVHHITFTSYKPLSRLLSSQLIAGTILMLSLASPLIIRLFITFDLLSNAHIIIGSIFIVLLASTSGILTKGKKLFEIVFFMITYANMNKIPFTDYFGGLDHNNNYIVSLTIITFVLGMIAFLTRRHQLKN